MIEEFRRYVGLPVESLPTPSVVLDRARTERNIERMAERMRGFGVALRPHWKTSKCLPVARMQVAAGAVGLTAATANEVRALVDGGIEDIFWAYGPWGEHRIATVLHAASLARIIVGGDSVEVLRPLAAAAADVGITVEYRLEIDTGLGRTGVDPDRALNVIRELAALPSLRLEGIYTHEGQVQGVGADPDKRRAAGVAAGSLMAAVAEELRRDGIELESVSVGSTPGSASAPSVSGITEARPGTYVYGDENQLAIGTVEADDCALTVLAAVTSVQRQNVALIDAGIKAMSSDGSLHGDDRFGTEVAKDGIATGGVLIEGHEEHGYLSPSGDLRVGDLVRIRPNHACGLSNMHSHIFVAEDDLVVDVWPISGRH